MKQKIGKVQAFLVLAVLIGLGWASAGAVGAAEAGGSLSLDRAVDIALKEQS